MRRMLTAKLQDSTDVLNRFTGVLSRRQVNVKSISVGYTIEPDIPRIAIIINAEGLGEVEQIVKQLNRLVNVLRVRDITDIPYLEREVILVKLTAPTSKRAKILAVIQPSRAGVVDVAPRLTTIQVTGNADRIKALLRVAKSYSIQNFAHTGATGFSRDFS